MTTADSFFHILPPERLQEPRKTIVSRVWKSFLASLRSHNDRKHPPGGAVTAC